MRIGVTRDSRPFAPVPDAGKAGALKAATVIAQRAMKGEPASRIAQATRALIGAWEVEDHLSKGDLRRRLEVWQRELDDALLAAEEYVFNAEGVEAKRQAECQALAVRAMSEAVSAQLEKMRHLI
ncbi:hypothetical protein EOD42_09015 [Rhodovarius crocodyli]|uniref:Uncharacterized protein n=1 Tax=Rhodovarius crocodyli TaxID=1979269 RepID=A0A437MJX5_9PROT|nr:hypothetical protein [Rhodovarius crocodyli]RVT97919.1 hypothetical protein EOD42_09015 [Rhodovarius crocodyli]